MSHSSLLASTALPAAPRAFAGATWNAPVGTEAARSARSHRGIILDLDDTLYPRARFMQSGFAAVARHVAVAYGVPMQAAYAFLVQREDAGQTGQELQALRDAFRLPHDVVPVLLDVYRRHVPRIWLYHDAAEALTQLRAGGWRLAVLTNGLPSVQFRKVAALNLATVVDDVIYAEEHAPGGKPGVAAFRAALESLELRPEQCICVGDDATRDIGGARNLGIHTIRVARDTLPLAPEREADMVIDTLAQLPTVAAMMLDLVTADVA